MKTIRSLWLIQSIFSYVILSLLACCVSAELPSHVTLAGTMQSELGCADDWQPACAATHLTNHQGQWRATFLIPAGHWEYKIALNDNWTESYGYNQSSNNAQFTLSAPKPVTFIYDELTHAVSDNATTVTAVGDFQHAVGCDNNWSPECALTLMQDAHQTGIYIYSTTAIPVGHYEMKVALNQSWVESYGSASGGNISFDVTQANQRVVFTYDAKNHQVSVGDSAIGNLKTAKAHWLARDTIALDLPSAVAATATVKLHFSPDGQLTVSDEAIRGGEFISLTYDASGLGDAIKTKYRHLNQLAAFKIAPADVAKIPALLKQQIAVSIASPNGELMDATALQFAGVLDDVFSYNGELGVVYQDKVPQLHLWAPTAKSVRVHIYDNATDAESSVVAMKENTATGVWTAQGDASWDRHYYLYEVEVFVRSTGRVEHNWVTDPYSIGLSINGKRSQFVNLRDADLKPTHWDEMVKPALLSPTDIVLYELHIRDFSIADASVPAEKRGTFLAFTEKNSQGVQHLKRLADAGLTHIHLLPAFDCASVNEIKSAQKTVLDDLSRYAPDSDQQQAAIENIRREDGFNWCYDPFHYSTPDGSYATNPEGVTRIREFREMVSSLNALGLRVVMDVVYNHTRAAYLSDESVLDKVVPNYYHRLNAVGDIETSTCCANTASENTMMEKLMVDSLKLWATEYKVDGFRFDIMGHHTKDNILKVKNTLQQLTLDKNGVDGKSLYLYGEGWNFGEVKDNARFTQATIGNMSGTGVGTFNDRIRDSIRGGSCCDSGLGLIKSQGFINGLFTAPNAENVANELSKAELLKAQDKIKIVLAGSLADFNFVDRTGALIKGAELDATGYTQAPSETINYIEAHDNETLFDIIQYKAPLETTMADRVRMQTLGNSLVLLAQGVPFLHAGQEFLRSKSFDRNSYDSGDWFNALDFTFQHNGWGKGLPLAQDNQQNWSFMKPRLANSALMPQAADILRARDMTLEFLRIRKSSSLFRLDSAEKIKRTVTFYNAGKEQIPGVIAMQLHDTNDAMRGENNLVLVNVNPMPISIRLDAAQGWNFALHPVLKNSVDTTVRQSYVDTTTGTFIVPGRTTAVFVATEKKAMAGGSSGVALLSSPHAGAFSFIATFLMGCVCLGIFVRRG